MSLQQRVADAFARVTAALLTLNDRAVPITATATPANGDRFILLRGGVPYDAPVDPLLVVGEGGSGGDSLPVDVVAVAPGQEVAVVVDGVWRRAPIEELINAAWPSPLSLWDEWLETRFPNSTSPSPPFIGAAIGSGTINNGATVVAQQDGYWHNGVLVSSSATANSGYRWQEAHSAIRFGSKTNKHISVIRPVQLTNVLGRYGFHDTTSSAQPADGAWIETNGATLVGKTRANATESVTTSSFTLALNTAYLLDVEVNAAGTLATFRVLDAITAAVLWEDSLSSGLSTLATRSTNAGCVVTHSGTTAAGLVILYLMGHGTVDGYNRTRGIRSAVAVLPSAFVTGQWSAVAAEGGIDLDITALPSAGSAAITAIRYRLDGGAPVTLAGTGTGPRSITGLTGGQAYRVQLQLVTSAGGGQWSDTKTVTPTSASGSTAPAAFTAGQWTAAATASPGEVEFNLTVLPADGGSAITALEYRVAAGAAIAFVGTGTGVRVVTAGLTAGVAADLQVRAVNAIGAGAWSDTKTVTPLAGGGGGAAAYLGETYTVAAGGTAEVTLPAGVTASDTVTAIAFSALGGAPATMAAPAGWTERTGVVNPSEGRGARVFTAPGNVATLTFSATQLTGVLVFATSAPIRNHDLIGVDYSGPGATGANRETPAVTAAADDLGVSVYLQYDDGTAGAMVDPGTPQAGWTREFFKNDLAPWISVLSRASLTAGSTGTVVHDSNGAFSGRFLCTGTYGA